MAQVNVDAGRIDAIFDAQRLARGDASLELLAEIGKRFDLLGSPADQVNLFIDGLHAAFSGLGNGSEVLYDP